MLCGEHANGIPREFGANTRADLATDTFVVSNLDRGDGEAVFFFCNRFDAINRTKRDADLTARAVIFINPGNNLGLLFFRGNFIGKLRDCFVVL